MTITTRAQFVAAYAQKQVLSIFKASTTGLLANGTFSVWRATGTPLQGAVPTTAALCNNTTTGAFVFNGAPSGEVSYIAEGEYANALGAQSASTLEVHDRLAHMGGLVGNVTTSQTVNLSLLTLAPSAARVGATDYSDVTWFLEWYTATGATGANLTLGVTFNDGTTSTVVIALPANVGGFRMIPITATVAGKFIRAVDTAILSISTGTAGNFGVTATRQRTLMSGEGNGKSFKSGYEMTGFPSIENDACLFLIGTSNGTASGAVNGKLILVQG